MELDTDESESIKGIDICIANNDVHIEGDVISLSSATTINTDSGIITNFPGEIGLFKKSIKGNGLYSMVVCIVNMLVEYEVMLGLASWVSKVGVDHQGSWSAWRLG